MLIRDLINGVGGNFCRVLEYSIDNKCSFTSFNIIEIVIRDEKKMWFNVNKWPGVLILTVINIISKGCLQVYSVHELIYFVVKE